MLPSPTFPPSPHLQNDGLNRINFGTFQLQDSVLRSEKFLPGRALLPCILSTDISATNQRVLITSFSIKWT